MSARAAIFIAIVGGGLLGQALGLYGRALWDDGWAW